MWIRIRPNPWEGLPLTPGASGRYAAPVTPIDDSCYLCLSFLSSSSSSSSSLLLLSFFFFLFCFLLFTNRGAQAHSTPASSWRDIVRTSNEQQPSRECDTASTTVCQSSAGDGRS